MTPRSYFRLIVASTSDNWAAGPRILRLRSPVLRNYSITPTRAPADIRDASHPAPIWRAPRGARRSDGGLVVSRRHDLRWRVRHTWTQRHVRSPAVVMFHPGFQDRAQMPLRQRDQPVQTLTPNRSDHPFADRIRLRAVRRRLQHAQAQRPDRFVQVPREDAVPVVNQVPVGDGRIQRPPAAAVRSMLHSGADGNPLSDERSPKCRDLAAAGSGSHNRLLATRLRPCAACCYVSSRRRVAEPAWSNIFANCSLCFWVGRLRATRCWYVHSSVSACHVASTLL